MSEPAYLGAMRGAFPQMRDLEIELMLASNATLQKHTGHTEHYHRRQAMQMLFPDRVWHAFRERAVESFWRAKRARIPELLWHGSSSSNKTGSLADLAIEVWLENPKATSIYITSPYEDATKSGIWAEIVDRFDMAREIHDFLPGKIKESENAIVMYDRNPKSFIQVVTVDQVGKLLGKKSRSFDAGMMIVIGDELPEFKRSGEALIGVLKNLRSVDNFMFIGAGNFADPNDALGRLSEPKREGGYESLDVELDHEWESTRRGLVIRFDGHRSPNVLAGEDKWPFVTTIRGLKDLEMLEGGQNTPGYYRFGRSFPMLDVNQLTITNTAKIRAGGGYLTPEYNSAPFVLGAHLDPGFGGDPCMLQPWRWGKGYVEGALLDVFELTEPPIAIPIRISASTEPDILQMVENQIATRAKELLDERKIPYRNFSFDGSLRASIVQAVARIIGMEPAAFDYGGPATTRKLSSLKTLIDPTGKAEAVKVKTARDAYVNFNTELHFAVASLIESGQLRGLNLSRKGVQQMVTRLWRWAGKKREIEPKVSREATAAGKRWGYKARNAGQSPNELDAIVGGVEMARRMGFRMAGVSGRTGGALEALDQLRREAEGRQVMASVNGQTLPQGKLHSMESDHGRIGKPLHH